SATGCRFRHPLASVGTEMYIDVRRVGGAAAMSRPARVLAVVAGVAFGTALIVYYIVSYLTITPPVVAATGSAPSVNLTLQTVASFGHPPHVDWVSYLAE